MASDILIVDDEADIRELVAGILQDEGYDTRTARDSDDALGAIVARRPNLVFLDIWLQGSKLDGLQLLDAIKQRASRTAGGDDLRPRQYRDRGRGDQARRLRLHREAVQGRPAGAGRRARAGDLAAQARGQAAQAAGAAAADLVGQVGGDQPAAPDHREGRADQQPHPDRRPVRRRQGAGRAHHPCSCRRAPTGRSSSSTPPRSRRSAWRSSCSASRPSNGADERKVGALEEAHGGTLFIDEIADMPRETQNKILRVLVDQTFQRVGGTTKVEVDVRIVSSTARNLEAEIAAGQFREDLYHRLSVVPIRVPPLAERREDIPDSGRLFHGPDFAGDRPAEAPHRRGRAWRCCSRTTGRATCASCATTSSG